MTLQIVLLAALTLLAVLAILAKDLLRSAIALAVASLLLGVVFFGLKAPYAGVFEISVVAGLITVLFMLTIALTKRDAEVRESRVAKVLFPVVLVAFIVVDALVMKSLLGKIAEPAATLQAAGAAASPATFGQVLWTERTFDLVGQLAVILAGVFGVLALFRKRDDHD